MKRLLPGLAGALLPAVLVAQEPYLIESADADIEFVIGGRTFEAQTGCIGWMAGDEVLFQQIQRPLAVNAPAGACERATLYNLRTRQVCQVLCR